MILTISKTYTRSLLGQDLQCFFLRCMSRQSVERDTVSVLGLIVNSDNFTNRRNVMQNDLLAAMTKKFECSINGRLKPQHTTSNV